jgi:hypothetical protein
MLRTSAHHCRGISRLTFPLVHGYEERKGDFILAIEESTIEVSDTCDSAIAVSTDGASLLGVTTGANISSLPDCVTLGDTSGAWYALEGTGKDITASTCQAYSTVSSTITVFRGDCDSLECVESITTPCGAQSSASFRSFKGVEYFLFVQDSSKNDRRLQTFVNDETEYETRVPRGSFTITVEKTASNDIIEYTLSGAHITRIVIRLFGRR